MPAKEVADIALVGEMKKNFAEGLDDFLNRYYAPASLQITAGHHKKKYSEDCSI